MRQAGYSHAEISDHLSLSAEQVRKRVAHAEVELAQALKGGSPRSSPGLVLRGGAGHPAGGARPRSVGGALLASTRQILASECDTDGVPAAVPP
jgi:hypothetical protein